jgi:hypothetical protein
VFSLVTQSTAWIFPLYLQLHYLPAETLFSASGIFCGGRYLSASQALLGSSDQWKVPASLSLFLKSEKIPALLHLGKGLEYRPFRDFIECASMLSKL